MRRTVETERTAPRGDLAYWSRTGERLIANSGLCLKIGDLNPGQAGSGVLHSSVYWDRNFKKKLE